MCLVFVVAPLSHGALLEGRPTLGDHYQICAGARFVRMHPYVPPAGAVIFKPGAGFSRS